MGVKKVELLAPAGEKKSFIAAINAGADAVYLSAKSYGARANAENFDLKELQEIITYAHLRGVLVYVTINTLIFNDELDDFIAYTDQLVNMHVDAFIVADLGMIHLLSHRYPHIELHASTQLNTHHIKQVIALKKLGIKRIVMAREVDIATIKAIKAQVDIEIEVFVHGALCISYSGQCLLSFVNGGRSANLGTCAQPCRLPYVLKENQENVTHPLYLLSTKDLMTIDHIKTLVEAGVDSFKIEGRMRRPEYTEQTVLSYRKAIYYAYKNLDFDAEDDVSEIKKIYHRGFTKGFMLNEKSKEVTHITRPNHQGVYLGKVIQTRKQQVLIELEQDLSLKDGIRFMMNHQNDYGLEVQKITSKSNILQKALMGDHVWIDVPKNIPKGTLVFKTKDVEKDLELSPYIKKDHRKVELRASISAKLGDFLSCIVMLKDKMYSFYSKDLIDEAKNHQTTKKDIEKHVSKLGHTAFIFKTLDIEIDQGVFVPIKTINDLRKEMINHLTDVLVKREEVIIEKRFALPLNHHQALDKTLVCSVHTKAQFDVCLKNKIKHIECHHKLSINPQDYHDIDISVIMPRLLNNQEIPKNATIHQFLLPDQKDSNWKASSHVNITNIYTTNLLMTYGYKKMTLSNELSLDQMISFGKLSKKILKEMPYLEVVCYGKPEVMLLKHCPIAKEKNTPQNCMQCEKKRYALKHKNGSIYYFLYDGDCKLKLIDETPIHLDAVMSKLIKSDITYFKLMFTNETANDVQQVIDMYQPFFNKKTSA